MFVYNWFVIILKRRPTAFRQNTSIFAPRSNKYTDWTRLKYKFCYAPRSIFSRNHRKSHHYGARVGLGIISNLQVRTFVIVWNDGRIWLRRAHYIPKSRVSNPKRFKRHGVTETLSCSWGVYRVFMFTCAHVYLYSWIFWFVIDRDRFCTTDVFNYEF